MVECCGKELTKAGIFLHCMECKKTRLIEFPHGKELGTITELIINHVLEYDPSWKEFEKTMHEMWKAGHYEGYEPELSKEWLLP